MKRNDSDAWSRAMCIRITLITVALMSIGALTSHASAPTVSARTAAAPTQPPFSTATKTITFSNYDWQVRSGTGGPGPNTWDDTNAWVDTQGALHLKITHVVSAWHNVEINTTDRLGFGTYQFDVTGPIDQLDPNVVLGLFNYPTPDVGPDGTNEIDVEFARWGASSHPNGNYTVWPAQAGIQRTSKTFTFTLTGITTTTHQFTWTPQYIAFQSAEGSARDQATPFANWSFQPAAFDHDIPQQAEPVHMNLWLFQGAAPTNGQEVEIIITRFAFTPLVRVYLPIVLK